MNGRSVAALLALLTGPAAAQDLPALYGVTGVAADDVLNIRDRPSASAAIVGAFPPDATGIEVVAIEGGWAMVNHTEGTGYAALSFLAPAQAPAWPGLAAPLHCFGTEPFWSLTWDPALRQATFTDYEDAPRVWPVRHLWPARPMTDLVALGMDEGTVLLRPGQCSDGMSDFTYGITFDLLLSGPDAASYSGCCSLILR